MIFDNVIDGFGLATLRQIASATWFEPFRLAGGTALNLQQGYRKSDDLDFFCDHDFDQSELIADLRLLFGLEVAIVRQNKLGVYTKVGMLKMDFLFWNVPFLFPKTNVDDIPMADLRDIAAMKLEAVRGRGEKKDYWDIGCLLEKFSLGEMMAFHIKRLPSEDPIAVLRYLKSYSDIDHQPDPIDLGGRSWVDIKKTIAVAVEDYAKGKLKNHPME